MTNGLSGATYGGAIHWKTPIDGLMIGASDIKDTTWNAAITDSNSITTPLGKIAGPFAGNYQIHPLNVPQFFGRYEKNRLMVAGEYGRLPVNVSFEIVVPVLIPYGFPYVPSTYRSDQKTWYGMASYKVTDKLTAGLYQSQSVDRQVALGPARYSKDWVLSARYDFNQFLYAKAEQHFIDGTEIDIDQDLNPGGLNPTTKLTILKVGVSF